jgi:hypothetical protein
MHDHFITFLQAAVRGAKPKFRDKQAPLRSFKQNQARSA